MNSLEYLYLSDNKLQGEIPASIGNICTLQFLYLDNNNLSGEITTIIQNSLWCNRHIFLYLDLSYNRFIGMLPNFSIFTSLRGLYLSNNQLTGGIPSFLSQAYALDLSQNKITNINAFLCEKNPTTKMEILDLSNNQIMGQLPDCWEHLNSIRYLDLSNNKLSGEIPQSMSTLANLEALVLRNNSLTGDLPFTLKNCSRLNILDVSENLLSGEIPKEIGYLHGLVSLNLSRNKLDGEIPSEMGNLNWLEFLDMSRNHFSGKIPSTLSKIDRLAMLDLSNNDLIGRIPWGRQLQNFDASSFEGNIGLCGEQINKSCPGDGEIVQPRGHELHSEDDNSKFHICKIVMGDYFVKILFAILICFLHTQQSIHGFNSPSHVKCNEKERPALLNFKHGLIDGSGMLSTWREDDNNSDCCKWKGIECNNETGHVHVLHLPGSQTHYLRGAINIISLFDLQNIQHLDLSFNDFRGTQIPQHMDSLKNLRYLNLSWSDFAGRIPHELGNLSKLEYLDLKENSLYGTIPSQLGKLTRLCYLDLKLFHIIESSHYWQQAISELIPILRELRLRGCQLSDDNISSLFPSHSNISTSLSILDLSYNWLTSSSFQLLFNYSHNLQELYLYFNNIVLPSPHFPNFPSLVILDLSRNNMTSSVFQANFNFSSKLRVLYLAYCNGFGRVMKSLEVLDLESNNLQGEIPSSIGNIRTLQQLNLGRNNLQGEIPISLGNICTLQKLLLNENNLSGEISSIIQNSSRCNKHVFLTMDLSYNQIAGVLPSLSIFTSLKELYLSNNQLTGDITEQHLTNLSNLESLDLTDNSLSLKKLWYLDLSTNQITGQLPDCWKNLGSLTYLDLSSNKLSGKIPQSMGTLISLKALALRNNNLTGDLSVTLKNCTDLNILDVSENLLSGSIPSWIGESFQQLKILSLRVNQFFGSVPVHLCYLSQIQLLDLSRNHLSGGIPTCLRNFTTMMDRKVTREERISIRQMKSKVFTELHEEYDPSVIFMWKGQDYMFWDPEGSIDLSSNGLTGEIPKEVGYLLGLVSLNLSRNNLNGEIPSEIGNLSSLEFIDLSRNHLSGEIPSTLSNIDRLAVLDLSNNDLVGRIPWGRQLQTFDASSFEGNIGLCGQQLNKSCPGDETIEKPKGQAIHDEDDNSVFYEALYMSLGIGFFVGFWGLLGPILLWPPWRNSYMRFLNKVTDYILVTIEVNLLKFQMWLKW
uniref:LRR receptor-like serine/threonine-protein kinase FLS2 n=1 Tax=Cajanus cajan TaxID=3821 RepID=A0A151R0Y2_CAJCA|nr:LRR receptor-like serine/threonine-protein kinase FLS2 [Cajanus cajan]